MQFLIQVLLTGGCSYILQQFFTAWVVMPAAMMVSLVMSNSSFFSKFLGGFAAISLLWMGYATIIDISTNAILSTKLAAWLGMNNVGILILVTGLVGGLLGGLGAASGQCIRNLFFTKQHKKRFKM